jgi:hypothetical protein
LFIGVENVDFASIEYLLSYGIPISSVEAIDRPLISNPRHWSTGLAQRLSSRMQLLSPRNCCIPAGQSILRLQTGGGVSFPFGLSSELLLSLGINLRRFQFVMSR